MSSAFKRMCEHICPSEEMDWATRDPNLKRAPMFGFTLFNGSTWW